MVLLKLTHNRKISSVCLSVCLISRTIQWISLAFATSGLPTLKIIGKM